jgi:hypothetical protein
MAMDDAEKQFYSDPQFELELSMMRLVGHLEYAGQKVEELAEIAEKFTAWLNEIAEKDRDA